MGRRRVSKRGAVTQVRRHLYQDDGSRDHRNRGRCELCALPEANPVHQVEPIDPEAIEWSHRITGESRE
jgi:hypothetical protein